ncbi:unnamed protein product [Vicia faba]|uniref:Uncharacterized protein n=1 Tax=Vicia faba TaxID=3906 RepID=A0AAV0Z926_VICFA|nr:unnamed protein product [Vicia faba]
MMNFDTCGANTYGDDLVLNFIMLMNLKGWLNDSCGIHVSNELKAGNPQAASLEFDKIPIILLILPKHDMEYSIDYNYITDSFAKFLIHLSLLSSLAGSHSYVNLVQRITQNYVSSNWLIIVTYTQGDITGYDANLTSPGSFGDASEQKLIHSTLVMFSEGDPFKILNIKGNISY